MSFYCPDNVIPRPWSCFSSYTISSVSEFLDVISEGKSLEMQRNLRARLRKIHYGASNKSWPSILEKEVIYPTPGAKEKTYDAWKDADKPDSFTDFAVLWNKNVAPTDQDLLKWLQKYGLPCFEPGAASLSITWTPNCDFGNLPADLQFTKALQAIVDKENNQINPKKLFKISGIMLKDVLIALALEANTAITVYAVLKNGNSIDELDFSLKRRIMSTIVPAWTNNQIELRHKMMYPNIKGVFQSEIDKLFYNECLPFQDAVKMGGFLKDLIDSRFKGLKFTMQLLESTKKPFVDLRYALEAEDLLTVMWARFYYIIVASEPIRRCPCGAIFLNPTRNQKFCTKQCQNMLNQQNFRAKKKQPDSPQPE